MDEDLMAKAHDMAFKNMAKVSESETCQCFYCTQTYPANTVVDFEPEDDGNNTAICPMCYMDTVLPSASIVLSKHELFEMMDEYFNREGE